MLAGRPEIARMDLADAVFLDTETTGLAGGTGTFAFLVGLGGSKGGTSSCVSSLPGIFMKSPPC